MQSFLGHILDVVRGDSAVTKGFTPEQRKTYEAAKAALESDAPISWTTREIEGHGSSMLSPAETTYLADTGALHLEVSKMVLNSGLEHIEQYSAVFSPINDQGPDSVGRVTLEDSRLAEEFYVRAEDEKVMEAASMPQVPVAETASAAAPK